MIRTASALAAAFLALAMAMPAHSALFGTEGLDPAFCKMPAARQTVVYVDDSIMTEGRTEWATKLATKLKATLAPGERVTVVRLSPANGHSQEIWSGCWPAYSASERQRLASESHFFSRSPIAALEDQQKFFMRDLSGALGSIYAEAKRPESATRTDSEAPPEKEIVRALASDEGRFAESQMTIRAILYSNMAENSDLGSVFKPDPAPENYGKKLGTYLRRSVFYAYGLGEGVSKNPRILEETRRFWTAALHSMGASVAGMGSDLNMANSIPVGAKAFNVVMTRNGQELDGRLSLLFDADGNLVDSWIGISRLSIAGLSGTFRCAEDGSCRLNASTNNGIATNSPTETLTLSGSERSGLSGQLGVKGALLYSIKASKAES